MYLNGLRGAFDESDNPWEGIFTDASGVMTMPAPSTQPPTNNTDWTGIFKTALTTWGNYAVVSKQADVAIKTAPYTARYGYGYMMPGAGASYPGSSPFPVSVYPASGASSLLLLAAIGVAAYLLLKR